VVKIVKHLRHLGQSPGEAMDKCVFVPSKRHHIESTKFSQKQRVTKYVEYWQPEKHTYAMVTRVFIED
jgi:hypothetical protein